MPDDRLGVNAIVARRPLPLAQLAASATGGARIAPRSLRNPQAPSPEVQLCPSAFPQVHTTRIYRVRFIERSTGELYWDCGGRHTGRPYIGLRKSIDSERRGDL